MKKIIVTGSRGLIGREVSGYLKSAGHRVTECDLTLGHDLADEQFVKEWFKKNKADCVVNLFALNDHVDSARAKSDLFTISLKSLEDYFKINLTCLFSVCREFARNNRKGTIVNFSSTYGIMAPYPRMYKGNQKHIGYTVSKAGVIQMTRHLAVHLAPKIRVNCIAPGGVKYKQGSNFIKTYSENVPIKRMMEAKELNKIVEYLCSDDSSYVTGSVFSVDGGWTAW
jgi:NAD(P)-dependent dehydrogenase (short-subunit alcohol dehydrogenase family)